ncbi:MAG: SUMF1/EgtB/PvdO family nonheme iron enzyme, partial [Candidatus Riflebacteria bacterium]|nr:SUMF1/EgtB/PvdO family nonheme iron enzyme [Candidatus Riflebacteria bacterium]
TPSQVRRLLREAKVLATLNHANILVMHDADMDGAVPYMISEFVEGCSLAERLRVPPPLSLRQVLKLAMRILEGLRAAHERGVIHRDLKPENIFLTRAGEPKIGDFGLAKAQQFRSGSIVGRLTGTPHYMSPEQCRGLKCTPASDLYAVGVVLFEIVTGRLPFPGPGVEDYLNQHITREPPLASSIRPRLPGELDPVLSRALEKDPRKRFETAAEFRRALQRVYRILTPGRKSSPRRSADPAPDPGDLTAGRVLAGRYTLARRLGQGETGQIWLASDEALEGTDVAVKILPPALWQDPTARTNLVKEAKVSLKLTHPNVVRLLTLEPGEPPFLVMEYVAGRSLAEELASRDEVNAGPMTLQEVLPVLEGLAAALDHAHAHGIIHRDLRPSHVMLELSPGVALRAKLADFGIAAELTSFETRRTGSVPTGTLAYMSPEQVACRALDPRSDVYSVAAVLYELLTLTPPFVGDDLASAIQNEPVPAPEDTPGSIGAVVLKALSKEPDQRPASVWALLSEFRRAMPGRVVPGGAAAGLGAGAAAGPPPTGPAGEVPGRPQSIPEPGPARGLVEGPDDRIDVPAPVGPGAARPGGESRPEPGRGGWWAVACGAALLAGFGLAGLRSSTPSVPEPGLSGSGAAPVVTGGSREVPSIAPWTGADQTPARQVFGPDGEEMILIPAGEFFMGSKTGNDDERPVHTVYLDAFFIDKHKVSNRRFARFVQATGYTTEAETGGGGYYDDGRRFRPDSRVNWRSPFRPGDPIEDRMDLPVVQVSWNDAVAYCRWAGKRLPTEAEWEKAARGGLSGAGGPAGRREPQWSATRGPGGGSPRPSISVGSYAPNGYGLWDMGGTVWEWCADWYDKEYYRASPRRNPLGPAAGSDRVLRGGSWGDHDPQVLWSIRNSYVPSVRSGSCGFRCAR